MSATVLGVGNEWRGDDGAGPAVARALRAEGVRTLELGGDAAALLDAWDGLAHVVVVDAVRSGAAPGTIHRLGTAAGRLGGGSTHALGVAQAVELARALGRLPARLELFGIEGVRFEPGEGLTRPVARAVHELASELRERLS
jgi:hydrogenase maturation protease